MKVLRNAVLVMVVLSICTLLLGVTAQGQNVRVSDILLNGTQLANSTQDSTMTVNKDGKTYYSIAYNGITYQSLVGNIPDSIRLTYYVTADSIYKICVRWKAKVNWAPLSIATGDSVGYLYSSTATATEGSILIAPTKYYLYDNFGISLVAYAASTNAVIKANASKVYIRVDRYFKQYY